MTMPFDWTTATPTALLRRRADLMLFVTGSLHVPANAADMSASPFKFNIESVSGSDHTLPRSRYLQIETISALRS